MEFVSIGEAVNQILGTYIKGITFAIQDNKAILTHATKDEGSVEYLLHEGKTTDEINAFALGMLKGLAVFIEIKNSK